MRHAASCSLNPIHPGARVLRTLHGNGETDFWMLGPNGNNVRTPQDLDGDQVSCLAATLQPGKAFANRKIEWTHLLPVAKTLLTSSILTSLACYLANKLETQIRDKGQDFQKNANSWRRTPTHGNNHVPWFCWTEKLNFRFGRSEQKTGSTYACGAIGCIWLQLAVNWLQFHVFVVVSHCLFL